MIFVINEKNFMKKKKKLVEPMDYIILDATDAESGSMSKFSNVVTTDGLNPPAKLVSAKAKAKDKLDIELDSDKIEKLEKKFFKGKEFLVSAMGAVRAIVDAEREFNVFIIMKNKAYKYYGSKIVKKIQKLFDVPFDFIFTYEELEENPKLYKKKSLKDSQLSQLSKSLKSLENKLTKDEKK